jgi:hypothetical protein
MLDKKIKSNFNNLQISNLLYLFLPNLPYRETKNTLAIFFFTVIYNKRGGLFQ